MRVVRFYVRCAAAPSSCPFFPSFLLPSSPDRICQLLIAVVLDGPHLPALDRSGRRRTSSASSWFSVGLAGPHLPALDCSGPRRTSSASSWSQWASPDLHCQLSCIAVGLAGPQPARVCALLALPDFNLPESERCGPRRRESERLWASPDFNRRDSARRGPRRTSTGPQRPETQPYRMPKRMLDRMPDRLSEDMTDRMPEDMPDRMPERISNRMPNRMPEDLPDRSQMGWIECHGGDHSKQSNLFFQLDVWGYKPHLPTETRI